jgi:hypothetical protein
MKWIGFACFIAVTARPAQGTERRPALFALLIGVNTSSDRTLPPLHYADDDAARYLDLFRGLGARGYLLSRLDENTARLQPQAAAEARLPIGRELDRLVEQLSTDVANARAQGVPTAFYLVYAGHGSVSGGDGYLSLEDRRLGRRELAEIFRRVAADEGHAIVDACYSFYLAFGRGPGGRRREVRGFTDLDTGGHSVGLLLSTSSARESHEWEGLQAGVFSHEVRSGLYGAADADGDGRVSYREMAAFVERANAAIPNERFRPDVYARPPPGSDQLLDLRHGLEHRIEIDRERHGQYTLEDQQGARLADFHSGPMQRVHLVHPSPTRLFLRRADGVEYAIDPGQEVIELAALAPSVAPVRQRGAAHEAFKLLFALPFSTGVVDAYVLRSPPLPPGPSPLRRRLGITAFGLAVASTMAGAALLIYAAELRSSVRPSDSQLKAANLSSAVTNLNGAGGGLLGVAGLATLGGILLFVVPQREGGAAVGVRGSF